MLTMCDLEHKQEYITGVLQTLQSAISDFQKLQHKLEVEQNFDKEKKESVAWDFSVQRQNTNQESESFEDVQEYFDDIEDTENVDFTLLTSLISEGKMTVEDAIVLMIRERAMLVDDTNNNASGGSNLFRNKNNLQNNNSFISKISIDLFDQDFEIDENGGNLIETESKMSKRSRSMTPSRVSLAKILNRLHWKILGMKQQQQQQENDNAIEEEENESIESGKKGKQKVKKLREKEEYEQKVAELDEKLLNAYKRKIQQQKNTRERIRKERERIQTIREKQLEKRNEKKEYVIRKMQDAEEKQKEHLRHIQQKARTEAEKLAEISFINMLETQNKRLTLDEKVEFVRERKLQIIKNVQGQQQQKQRDEAAEKKRQEQQKQLEQKFLTQKLKLEEADSRRLKILESKKKNPSDVNQKALMAKKRKTINEEEGVQKMSQCGGKEKLKQNFIKNSKLFTSALLKTKTLKNRNKIIIDQTLYIPKPRPTQQTSHQHNLSANNNDESIQTLESNEIPSMDQIQMKMNSMDNLVPEIKVLSSNEEDDEEYPELSAAALTNSIIFYEPKRQSRLKQKQQIQAQLQSQSTLNKQIEQNELQQSNKKRKKKSKKKKRTTQIGNTKTEKKLLGLSTSLPSFTDISNKQKKHIYIKTAGPNETVLQILFHQIPKFTQKQQQKLTIQEQQEMMNINQFQKELLKQKEERKSLNTSVRTSQILLFQSNVEQNENQDEKLSKNVSEVENKDKEIVKNDSEIVVEEIKEEQKLEEELIRWCSICNYILPQEQTNEIHLTSKQHKKIKQQYQLTNSDDLNCILDFNSEQIKELKAERLQTFKKRCKLIKSKLIQIARKSDFFQSRDFSSPNKQRIQKLSLDMEKAIYPEIKDTEKVISLIKELHKLQQQHRENDSSIIKQLKFFQYFHDCIKRVGSCHKTEIPNNLKIITYVAEFLQDFCQKIDNRLYMLATNRVLALVDLLNWCVHRPTKFVYSLQFVPEVFALLGRLVRQKVEQELIPIRELIIEYIFCSGVIQKLKQKFLSFNSGLDLSSAGGKVPLALLKSVAFLESLTNCYTIRNKYIYEEAQITDSIIFVIQETDLFGIISLIASILLQEGSVGRIQGKMLPTTIISLTMIAVKVLNNVSRLNLKLVQYCVCQNNNLDFLYHIFNYLLTYCDENYDKSDDAKELLNEIILLIGYLTFLNKQIQDMLGRGQTTLIQKLCNLNWKFFVDKSMKELLFPTLLCSFFLHTRNLEIIMQEISSDLLLTFLQSQINQNLIPMLSSGIPPIKSDYLTFWEFLKTLHEEDGPIGKTCRSLSISSTTSSQNSTIVTTQQWCFAFQWRFPREFVTLAIEQVQVMANQTEKK